MTDDEVREWLSEEEAVVYSRATLGLPRYGSDPLAIAASLRSLAETRKALAEHEWIAHDYAGTPFCQYCGEHQWVAGTPHAPGCIFATMPRPR